MLHGKFRKRINRAAHLQGQRHEANALAAMLAQVQAMSDAGATFDQLDAAITGFESGRV
jgi:hypothetical protein